MLFLQLYINLIRLANLALVINNSTMARYKRVGVLVGAYILSALLMAPYVYAVDPKSNNYQFNESSIGTGGYMALAAPIIKPPAQQATSPLAIPVPITSR